MISGYVQPFTVAVTSSIPANDDISSYLCLIYYVDVTIIAIYRITASISVISTSLIFIHEIKTYKGHFFLICSSCDLSKFVRFHGRPIEVPEVT